MQATKESGGSKEHTFTPPADAVLEVQQPPPISSRSRVFAAEGFREQD